MKSIVMIKSASVRRGGGAQTQLILSSSPLRWSESPSLLSHVNTSASHSTQPRPCFVECRLLAAGVREDPHNEHRREQSGAR